MQILYSRCCGIDVHKDSLTVCVLVYIGQPDPDIRKKAFESKHPTNTIGGWGGGIG